MGNVSKQETCTRMMRAVVELMDEGFPVNEISGFTVTEHCGVDKMYVNRYFQDLAGLFMATIEHLLVERMNSMISTDVFSTTTQKIDANVEKAFKIASHLSEKKDCQDRLTELGRVVSATYAKQLEEAFGLSPKRALLEAKIGLLFINGYLSLGTILELEPQVLNDILGQRRIELKKNS